MDKKGKQGCYSWGITAFALWNSHLPVWELWAPPLSSHSPVLFKNNWGDSSSTSDFHKPNVKWEMASLGELQKWWRETWHTTDTPRRGDAPWVDGRKGSVISDGATNHITSVFSPLGFLPCDLKYGGEQLRSSCFKYSQWRQLGFPYFVSRTHVPQRTLAVGKMVSPPFLMAGRHPSTLFLVNKLLGLFLPFSRQKALCMEVSS